MAVGFPLHLSVLHAHGSRDGVADVAGEREVDLVGLLRALGDVEVNLTGDDVAGEVDGRLRLIQSDID